MAFPDKLPDALLNKAAKLGVLASDIEEQFIVGGGKGGQKINKTASCVQLKHSQTGIIIRCQKHREQSKNRLSAYKLLILKIEQEIKGRDSELAKRAHKIRKQKQRRSKKAKEKLLELKKRRSDIKKNRGNVDPPYIN